MSYICQSLMRKQTGEKVNMTPRMRIRDIDSFRSENVHNINFDISGKTWARRKIRCPWTSV